MLVRRSVELRGRGRSKMLLRIACAGDGHWVCFTTTLMFGWLVMPILFQATMSTAALISDSVIVTRCEAPAVREGDNTTLTCHFDSDLRITKQGVKVVQYNSQTFDKTVLSCLWNFDEANCIEKYGFKLYGEISNELRLNIPRVTKEHAGTYACIVFDTEPGTRDTCFLNVIARGPSTTETSSDGCHGNALGCNRDEFPYLPQTMIAASVLVSVVILLMIVGSLFMCKRGISYRPVQSEDMQNKQLIT